MYFLLFLYISVSAGTRELVTMNNIHFLLGPLQCLNAEVLLTQPADSLDIIAV